MKQAARRAARVAGSPLLNYVNRQFARMESVWAGRIDRLEHRLLGDIQANVELTAAHARVLTEVRERLDELRDRLIAEHMLSVIGRSPAEIDLSTAELANWIQSHLGFASQAHHWINQGVAVEHRVGGIGVAGINERTVEVPFVLQALSGLEPPARIFDFGSLESLIPLFLGSLGHHVTALDLYPYPFAHPNIHVATSLIQEWPDPREPYDAVISLSTIEHIGLESYGQHDHKMGLDEQTMHRFRSWLRPGGLLVLTAPFGRWHVDEFQRVYDEAHLKRLLTGFRVVGRRFARQDDGVQGPWVCTEEPPNDADRGNGAAGVVLVTATPEL